MKLIPDKHFPELKRDPKTGIYYVVKFMKGKGTLFRSTGETDREKARREALRMLTEFTGLAYKGYVPTFNDLSVQIIAERESKRYDPDTLASAKLHFKRLNPVFGMIRVDALTGEAFNEYVDNLRDENPNCRLFNDYKHFMMVANRAWSKGFLRQKIEIDNPDEEFDSPGRELSDEEIAKLIKRASAAKWSKYIPPKPILVQVVGSYTMGMRKNELLTLEKSDIDLVRHEIHLKTKRVKTRQGRSFKMNPFFFELLKRHLAKFESPRFRKKYARSPWVFPSPTDPMRPVTSNKSAWKALKQAAGVQCRFHDLRHTFLTRALLRLKLNPYDVSVYAGVSLQTLERVYLHPHPEHTKAIASAMTIPYGLGEIEKSRNDSGNSGK
jgi:integrase